MMEIRRGKRGGGLAEDVGQGLLTNETVSQLQLATTTIAITIIIIITRSFRRFRSRGGGTTDVNNKRHMQQSGPVYTCS